MESKSIFVFMILTVLLCCITTVSAEDIDDENLNLFSQDTEPICEIDENEIDSTEEGSLKDLQTDITNADSVINLTKDYKYKSGDSEVKISKKITINGNNHIIDAQNSCRIFNIVAPHVTLINLTFINGHSSADGGAINTFKNDLTIKDCKFINNHAKNGGAIYAYDNPVRFNLIDCEFINNSAQYGKGGAIFCSGFNSNIINTTFIGNNAQNGGSIYWGESKKVLGKNTIYGNEAKVINSTFIKNSAVNGGAVFWFANAGKIINSTFKQNFGYNADNGGAIYWKGQDGVVENTKFIQNTAESRAGAIYWEGSKGCVTNSIFINNTAYCIGSQFNGGGAIMWKGKYGVIKNSNFTSNQAYTEGGAINWYETNDAKGEISNCNFQYNKALAGSALFMHYGSLDIENSSFFNNQAGSDDITCELTKQGNNIHLTSVFTGNNNMINAIYNYKIGKTYWEINLNNTLYWGIDGEMNTNDGNVIIDDHKSKFAINFEVYDSANNLVKNLTCFTNIDGMAEVDIDGLNPGNYTARAIHYEDNYYDEIMSKTTTFVIDKLSTKITANHAWDKSLTHDDIKVNVFDENNKPVQFGTCELFFENDMTYEAEVINGVAIFKNVEMPLPGNYDENVKYIGNEMYEESNGDVEITVLKLDSYTYDHNVTHITPHEIFVVVTVIDEFNNPVESGEVELDIYYEDSEPLKQNVLAASKNYELEKEVFTAPIKHGKAAFDVVLSHNGHYLLDAEYLGDRLYNPSHDEVIAESYALNTTIKSEDIDAKSGETRDVTCDIVDQDGKAVKNGTATLRIGDKTYRTNVVDGKATFENVEMPDSDTVAFVDYIGNDDYNSSNSTFKINIAVNDTSNSTEDENTTETIHYPTGGVNYPEGMVGEASFEGKYVEEARVDKNSTGNPIFAILIVLITLVCNFSLKRRK